MNTLLRISSAYFSSTAYGAQHGLHYRELVACEAMQLALCDSCHENVTPAT